MFNGLQLVTCIRERGDHQSKNKSTIDCFIDQPSFAPSDVFSADDSSFADDEALLN